MIEDYDSRYFKECLQIYYDNFPYHSYDELEILLQELIDSSEYNVKLMIENKKVLGFIVFKIEKDKSEILLEEISVSENFQNTGIGKLALNYLIMLKENLKLGRIKSNVKKNNLNAIKFFKKMGFKKEGSDGYSYQCFIYNK